MRPIWSWWFVTSDSVYVWTKNPNKILNFLLYDFIVVGISIYFFFMVFCSIFHLLWKSLLHLSNKILFLATNTHTHTHLTCNITLNVQYQMNISPSMPLLYKISPLWRGNKEKMKTKKRIASSIIKFWHLRQDVIGECRLDTFSPLLSIEMENICIDFGWIMS